MDEFSRTDRSTLRRLPKREVYDRSSIDSIVDEGLICHLGFVVDGEGQRGHH
jgi:nitroimidazol reductase NimA-like FMN-containing flavoprotein (pyridoxamine 5'-phosphate oxidase superfamily)